MSNTNNSQNLNSESNNSINNEPVPMNLTNDTSFELIPPIPPRILPSTALNMTSIHSHSLVSPAPSLSTTSPSPPRSSLENKKFVGSSYKSHYEVLEKLGEGTFGQVHKAKRKSTGCLVALKRIIIHSENEGVPITGIREISILKRLSHINVIKVIDTAFEPGPDKKAGHIYMVTPYMEHDLSGLLENPRVHLTLGHIKCYMKQLFEGLCYLHSNHLIHRDIKAANLLIDNDGILKIADFGLARRLDPTQPRDYTNCVVTRWYRPPELLLGEKKYDSSVDIWGAGCVYAECLTGKPLLPGKSDLDQLNIIFKLCGTPTQENMPNWDKLPGCEGVKEFTPKPRDVLPRLRGHDPLCVDLLDKILVLNPKQRLTAHQVLDHDSFYSEPYPTQPRDLPKFESSHEVDRRRFQQEAQKIKSNRNHRNERRNQNNRRAPPYHRSNHSRR